MKHLCVLLLVAALLAAPVSAAVVRVPLSYTPDTVETVPDGYRLGTLHGENRLDYDGEATVSVQYAVHKIPQARLTGGMGVPGELASILSALQDPSLTPAALRLRNVPLSLSLTVASGRPRTAVLCQPACRTAGVLTYYVRDHASGVKYLETVPIQALIPLDAPCRLVYEEGR